MKINVYETKKQTSKKAAEKAVSILNSAIKEKGEAAFVIATGNSQLDFIEELIKDNTVDWSKTKMYHLDEYIGISEDHPASFRKYLKEKFISQVPELGEVILVNGNNDPEKECKRLNEKITGEELDIAFIGIGENGHIAFNDPPADFDTEKPFIIVKLDQKCREQQVNEGWFETINDVPRQAISMSVQQIKKFDKIICTVPGQRKAKSVKDCFTGWQVDPEYPASILKIHDNANIYLDQNSASLLDN